jgi:hypothetical protein
MNRLIALVAPFQDIPNEPFESRIYTIRRSLAWPFFHTHAAEVYVTDGRNLAHFKVGSDDYDLDGGCLLIGKIPVKEISDVQKLIEEIATFIPPYSQKYTTFAKGIVPLDDKVEEALKTHPGIELKFRDVKMPYGLGNSVNYYTGKLKR